jgi:hypothetical protein
LRVASRTTAAGAGSGVGHVLEHVEAGDEVEGPGREGQAFKGADAHVVVSACASGGDGLLA